MAIDFPSSPTVGQQYTYNNVSYTYTSQGVWLATGAASVGFGAGTATVFVQAAAPTGWVKDTTHNDKALRIVSSTGGTSGGTVAFSTAFARTATDTLTLAVTQMPGHNHTGYDGYTVMTGSGAYTAAAGGSWGIGYGGVGFTGGGQSHSHGIDLRVQYVDSIICVKS